MSFDLARYLNEHPHSWCPGDRAHYEEHFTTHYPVTIFESEEQKAFYVRERCRLLGLLIPAKYATDPGEGEVDGGD